MRPSHVLPLVITCLLLSLLLPGCRSPQPVADPVRVKADATLINSMASRTPEPSRPAYNEPEILEPYVPEAPAYAQPQASQSCPGGVCGPRPRLGIFRRWR